MVSVSIYPPVFASRRPFLLNPSLTQSSFFSFSSRFFQPPALKSLEPDTPSHSLTCPQTSSEWFARAAYRKEQVDKYCWNEGHGLYYDYDTNKEEQSVYETVTAFWPMWAGMSSPEQAASLM